MAVLLYNFARMYTDTEGTGTLRLVSRVPPFLSFVQAGVVDGDQVYYSINDFFGGNVEIGVGTYSASGQSLTRDTVYRSSSGGTGKINLSGRAEVAVDPPKEFFATYIQAVGTIRTPPAASSVPILLSDIEIGIDTSSSAVNALLPSATTWASTNRSGLELVILDYTGQGDTHNITPVPDGADTFLGGLTPLVTSPYGLIKLRPIPGLGWYLRQ